MSIRTSFNPMGTLGSDIELPYVQPVMTGPATVSNTPSFACTISGEPGNGIFLWNVFAESGKSGYWGWRSTPATLILTFERPLKINAIQCNFTLNGIAVVTNENGATVANLQIINGLRSYNFQNAGYHKVYKFTFQTTGYIYGYKITLDAVYKA